jgi:hypothetical protein
VVKRISTRLSALEAKLRQRRAPWMGHCPACGLIVGRVIFNEPDEPKCPKGRELRAALPPHAPIRRISIHRVSREDVDNQRALREEFEVDE